MIFSPSSYTKGCILSGCIELNTSIGSPPHIRGTQWGLGVGPIGHRLTPMHAGKTDPETDSSQKHAAHPHACGENARCLETSMCHLGSPPHIRGTRLPATTMSSRARLIPAHTGKTQLIVWIISSPSAHPRAYREYLIRSGACPCLDGSSPHIQGIHLATRHDA